MTYWRRVHRNLKRIRYGLFAWIGLIIGAVPSLLFTTASPELRLIPFVVVTVLLIGICMFIAAFQE